MKDAKNRTLLAIWLLTIVATFVLYVMNMNLGNLNQDEGWYLYAARLVSQGKTPFVDFASTQGPVMAYVYSLAQPMVDALGVAGGRLFTAFLGLLSVIISALLANRMAKDKSADHSTDIWAFLFSRGMITALVAFILLGVNVYQCYFTAIVKTYALAGLFIVLGFLALSYIDGKRGSLAVALSGILFALAVGTRTSAVVILPVVFIGLALHSRKVKSLKYILSFTASAVLTLGLIFLPFLIKAREAFWFGLVEYHAGRETGGLKISIMRKVGAVCRMLRGYLAAFAVLVVVCSSKFFHKERVKDNKKSALFPIVPVVWISVIAVALLHLSTPFPYDEYQVIIYPLFAAVLAVSLERFVSSRSDTLIIVVTIFLLSCASTASSTYVEGWFMRGIDRLWVVPREISQLRQLQIVGKNIKSLSGGEGELLTQDTYLAVETGLNLPAGLELGPFSYFPDYSREKAEECHVINKEMFIEIIKTSDAQVAAVSGYGFTVTSPSVTELPDADQMEMWQALLLRYQLMDVVDPFGQSDSQLGIFTLTGEND